MPSLHKSRVAVGSASDLSVYFVFGAACACHDRLTVLELTSFA
ncbi:hypothetical protein [Streptomyces sp. cg40]